MKLQWCQIKEMKSSNLFLFSKFFSNKNNNISSKDNNQVRFISLRGENDFYLLIFVETDVYIYSIDFVCTNLSSDLKENFVFKSKQFLDFIAYNDKITNIKAKKSSRIFPNSNSLVISTDSGDIFLITINLCDFYIEVVFKFNIRQNFIHEYEILDYEDDTSILLTIDKHLFLYEIYRRDTHQTQVKYKTGSISTSNTGNHPTIGKNLLMRIEYLDEKIIDAYLTSKQYVVIITNKMIYYVNLDNDGSKEILLKKDIGDYHMYYSGILYDNKIYYIKADNSLCVHPIYEPHNKFTVTISTKNQLNKVNFYKVIYADEEITAIVNKKQTEIYFFNSKYKLISRESILLENSQFIFTQNGIVVISYNWLGMNVKYKIGMFIRENAPNTSVAAQNTSPNFLDKFNRSISSNHATVHQADPSDCFDLNEIENNFVVDKKKIQKKNEKIKNIILEIKTDIREYLVHANRRRFNTDLNDDLFEGLKLKINLKLTQLNKSQGNADKIAPGIFANLIKNSSYINGSSLLRKCYKILNLKYFQSLYKEKIFNLLKIAYKTKDFEAYKELQSLLIRL